jgi:hypothetical protein
MPENEPGGEPLSDRAREALRQDMIKGEQARQLAASPLLAQYLNATELGLLRKWMDTKEDATAERERIWWKMQAHTQLREELTRLTTRGTIATDRLRADAKEHEEQ